MPPFFIESLIASVVSNIIGKSPKYFISAWINILPVSAMIITESLAGFVNMNSPITSGELIKYFKTAFLPGKPLFCANNNDPFTSRIPKKRGRKNILLIDFKVLTC